MTAAGASVRLPPVLVFAGGWLAAWALHRRLSFDIDGAGPTPIQIALGASLALGGAVLMGWAIRTLIMARTTIVPHGAVRQLVTHGPFAFTRNPIYLGMTAIYLGAAALANAAWPLVLLPVVLALTGAAVVHREEQYLLERFGAEYAAYCRRVRRWL